MTDVNEALERLEREINGVAVVSVSVRPIRTVLDALAEAREVLDGADHTAAKYWRLLKEAEAARDRAKRAAKTLGEIVERQVEDTLRWAGMDDQIGVEDPDQQLAWERCAEMPTRIKELEAERDRYRAAIVDARAEQRDYTIPHDEALSNIGTILTRALNEPGESDDR
ncbi:hypothetical protein [Streptomyces sp. AC495_CC817]|uniref:hypothetical protein n=1 Tax=Streptomyces sp. AC495_CC817 TaxID=2823900 RepID=UPI001C280C9B|nr:hypothetical protein [Streptomyces sp. AC495_CC817]